VELVGLLRVLWRYRIAVAAGAVVAMAVSVALMSGAKTRVGVASTVAFLDTPTSLTVDVNPPGMDTLEWRSRLLADLMSTRESRQRIADKMKIPIDSLVVRAPYMSVPPASFPLPRTALEAGAAAPEPYVLAIESVDLPPLIEIDSRAPDRKRAAELVVAAVDALKAASATQVVPGKTEQFVVEAEGTPEASEIASGPGRIMPAILGVLLFGLWCAGIMLFDALRRARRGRSGARALASGVGWS
jgi:hypothetical protein